MPPPPFEGKIFTNIPSTFLSQQLCIYVIIGKALVLNQYCVANYRSGYFWIWARSRLCISTKRCILYNRRNLEKKKKSIGPGEKLSGDDASGARARPPQRVKIDLYIFRTGRSFF
jgi:hypothetical protein